MCTCIDFRNNNLYFGRSMDIEYNFGEEVVITPINYNISLKNGREFKTKYAIIGMATVENNYPLYAEAANEKGLCIAGLNFPKNAYYGEEKEGFNNIATFEIIPWILGNFSSIEELQNELEKLNITNKSFMDNGVVPTLHWMISDSEKSIVLEQTKDGLDIYENKYGVLTNNPPFYYHKLNVNNYINLSPKYPENRFSKDVDFEVFGQGMGTLGLPGDVTPPSRFIRALFNKSNAIKGENEEETISQFFHILDSVSMIKGTVITDKNELDYTTYESCINASLGKYYFKTYNNNQINMVELNEENKNAKVLTVYKLPTNQNINKIN